MDASRSFDPDMLPGDLSFSWACRPPAPPPPAGALVVSSAAPPRNNPPPACLASDGTPIDFSLRTGPLLPLQLLGSAAGLNYTISVTVEKGGRVSTGSVWLVVRSDVSLPVISVVSVLSAKQDPAAKLTLRAIISSSRPQTLSSLWSVVSPPQLSDLLSRPGATGTALTSQSLVVNGGFLPSHTTVIFRLTATDSGGTSTADVPVPVSGAPTGLAGPGSLGTVSISPLKGFGLNTTFSLSADDWTDIDLPLSYSFAYTVEGLDAPPVLLRSNRPEPSMSGVLLPAGDPVHGNRVNVICFVSNAAGITSQSAAVSVEVAWQADLLQDPKRQSAIVEQQAAEAQSKARGNGKLRGHSKRTPRSALLAPYACSAARESLS